MMRVICLNYFLMNTESEISECMYAACQAGRFSFDGKEKILLDVVP